MKPVTLSALFFAASIALAIAYPARNYYYDDEDYPEARGLIRGRPVSLASAPFYYQARTLELEQFAPRGRKYQIVKKKKKHGAPQNSDEDDAQDDEGSDESSEEEDEEEDEENNEEEAMEVPPWEELFPEEDKNTGTFQTPQDQGYGDQSGGLDDLPGGAPAPENSGSLLNLFSGGPQSDPVTVGGGGPPQYRQGPPPPPPYQAIRARTSIAIPSAEEPRSGGAVLYDGYRYIPVKPVHVRVPQREPKKIKSNKKETQEKPEARSSVPSSSGSKKSSSRQTKKIKATNRQQYVLVPVGRDPREIRFSRDQHGLKVESGSLFAPTEIWRWEGPGGRPLRRRENRPSGLYYAPRPQRGSASTVRFAEENNY